MEEETITTAAALGTEFDAEVSRSLDEVKAINTSESAKSKRRYNKCVIFCFLLYFYFYFNFFFFNKSQIKIFLKITMNN